MSQFIKATAFCIFIKDEHKMSLVLLLHVDTCPGSEKALVYVEATAVLLACYNDVFLCLHGE